MEVTTMLSKPDADIIDVAYESTITQVYSVFFNSMVTAQNDQDKNQAAQTFHEGVQLARSVREKAKQLL
jgi:hypothetical protein